MSDYDAYTHQMTGNMKEIPSEAERIIKSDDENCWNIPIVDDCISSLLYYKGLGGPYHSCTYPFSFGEISNTFVYYKKGDTEWGTPLIITSLDTKKGIPDGIRIYPNPADNYLNVEYPLTGEKTAYEIVNCMGETISMKGEFFSEVQAIPIAFLPAGLYCIKLTDTSGNVYSQTFIKK